MANLMPSQWLKLLKTVTSDVLSFILLLYFALADNSRVRDVSFIGDFITTLPDLQCTSSASSKVGWDKILVCK